MNIFEVLDNTIKGSVAFAFDVMHSAATLAIHPVSGSTRLYRRRRDSLTAAVSEHMPDATIAPVHGGLFAWIQLPAGVSTRPLLPAALEHGVEYAPGDQFFVEPADGDRSLRLNFATVPPGEIERGIARLADVVRRYKSVLGP